MRRLFLATMLCLAALPALAGPVVSGGANVGADLTTIANLVCTNGVLYRTGGTWTCADTLSAVEFGAFAASRAIASDASGYLTESATTATQLGYLSDTTEPIGAALNARAPAIADPNASKLRGWDDVDEAEVYMTIGSGLTYTPSTNTLTAAGGTGETVNVLTGSSAVVSGGTYLYNGGGAGDLTLPTSSAGGGPIGIRNNTAQKITVLPNVETDVLETAIGTAITAGHKVECTGATCWGRLYSIAGKWLWLGVGGTWSDGGAAAAAGFSSDPASKAFGSITVDQSSSEQVFTITNSGTAALNVTSVAIATGDSTQFSAGSETCVSGSPIAASGTCTARATFSPTGTGAKTSALRFATTELGNQDVALTGTGAGATTWLWECGWETGTGAVNTSPVDPEDYWNSATAGTTSVSSTYYWKGTKSLQFAWGGATGYAIANNAGTNWGRSGTTYLYGAIRVGSGFTVDHYYTKAVGMYGTSEMSGHRARVAVFRDGSTDRLGATCNVGDVTTDIVSGGDTHHNWPAMTAGSWYQFEIYWDNTLHKAGFRAWDAAGTLLYPTSGTWAELTGTQTGLTVETVQAGNNDGVSATIQLDQILLSDAAIGAQ